MPSYFQREVMDGTLEDRDGLGVDLCLVRQLGQGLRYARALGVLSQSNQRNSGAARVVLCKYNKRESDRFPLTPTSCRVPCWQLGLY